MGYNYVLLNEGFYRWLETNYLPIQSQIMFLKLIHLFNVSGWSEWLAVDNQRIMSLVQTKREQSVIEWRNKLLENNLIVYIKGKKGLPNKYKLNDKLTFINVAKSVVKSVAKSVVKSVVNNVVESVGIYKQNKTKQNKKENTANAVSKKKFGEFSNVHLTEAEYEKLKAELGEELLNQAIKYLDEYIEEKGYKSKSHNLAIRRWVLDAVKERNLRGTAPASSNIEQPPKIKPSYDISEIEAFDEFG